MEIRFLKFGENGEVICKKATISGVVLAEKSETQEVGSENEECKPFGFLKGVVGLIKWAWNALNGGVTINSNVAVTTTGCNITITGVQVFIGGSITYINNGRRLKAKTKIKGMVYKGEGSTCSHSGSNGEYEGEVELEGNKPPELINVE